MLFKKIKERSLWSLAQVFSIRHFIGMVLFVILFTCNSSEIPIEKVLMTLVFTVFCTYEQLGYALVSGVIIGVIIAFFPFISILIPFLIIAGMVKNIKFIWKNKYAVYLSLAVVMAPSRILDVIFGRFYDLLKIPVDKIFELIGSWKSVYMISARFGISYQIIIVAIFFNVMMLSLYLMKYSVKEAFVAIGMMPLLMLALIIPAVMKEISEAVTVGTYDSVHNNSSIGTHDVSGYYRSSKNGKTHYVDPYIRTNPDGIECNNFSYKGD